MQKTKWIVVIERSRARIFLANPFRHIETLENELGREKNKAMTTDKPGWSRSKLAQPSSTHSLTGEKNPHEDAAVDFARRISRHLEHEAQAHNFEELTIVAEPKMTGRIRQFLGSPALPEVEWLRKDWSHLSDHEIGAQLGADFRNPMEPAHVR